LKDQLAKILKLQKDAGSLAAQGYSQTFIDQIIAKGPDVGDQMAQAVLNATPDTANQIKSLFGQIDDVSQTGLDKLAGTMSDKTHLATVAMAREYAQVGIDMKKSLADNQAQLTSDLADQQTKYQQALRDAQQTLDDNLKAISKSMDDKLVALQDKINAAAQALYALNAIPVSPQTSVAVPYAAGTAYNPQYGNAQNTTAAPVIGSLTQNVYTTDPSLPSIGAAATSAVLFGLPLTVTAPYSSIYGSGK
jgi:hypothetical protein